MKITFIGGGNMAIALIGGMRRQGFSAAAIQVVELFEESREKLTEAFGVRCTATVDAAALNCEVLVLAVKPQQLRDAVAPFRGKLDTQLVVSIAAGLRMARSKQYVIPGPVCGAIANSAPKCATMRSAISWLSGARPSVDDTLSISALRNSCWTVPPPCCPG